jgi:hypothetical protein
MFYLYSCEGSLAHKSVKINRLMVEHILHPLEYQSSVETYVPIGYPKGEEWLQ